VNPPRSLARHPLFQTMVAHEDGAGSRLELPGARTTPWVAGHDSARFDVALRWVEAGGEPARLVLTAAADLFAPATVARLARRLTTWLELVLTEPEVPLGALSPLLSDERDRALTGGHVRRAHQPEAVIARFA